jgi:hypothetical protein
MTYRYRLPEGCRGFLRSAAGEIASATHPSGAMELTSIAVRNNSDKGQINEQLSCDSR